MDNNISNKNVTMDDIAKELGIAKSTVSKALSGKGRVGKDTIRRVQECISKYNYTPNSIARSLANSRTYNIGVMLPKEPDLSHTPFFHNCLIGITQEVAAEGYDVLIIMEEEDDIEMPKRLVENHKVDGVILTRSITGDAAMDYLKGTNLPFVLVGSSEDENVIQVDGNHIESSERLTSLLLADGIRRIGLLTGWKRHTVNKYRCEGYHRALERYNIVEEQDMIYEDCNSVAGVERAVFSLLKKGAECIVCTDDVICQRVLFKLNAEGYSIPEDIKVASLHDSLLLETFNPPVTAVEINPIKLGMVAGRRMLEAIEGKQGALKELVDYEIHLRRSTK